VAFFQKHGEIFGMGLACRQLSRQRAPASPLVHAEMERLEGSHSICKGQWSVNPHIAIIGLGVRDFDRAKQFYSEGLGGPIQQEQGEWICFSLGDGSSALTLYPLGSTC
jgi:hypothetical protein